MDIERLKKLNSLATTGVRELFDRLIEVSNSDHDLLGGALSRWVQATNSGDGIDDEQQEPEPADAGNIRFAGDFHYLRICAGTDELPDVLRVHFAVREKSQNEFFLISPVSFFAYGEKTRLSS